MANVKNFALNSTPELEAQIAEFANSEAFKNETIRIMADGHVGIGAVVGSTLTYSDKIVPNVVGVDISCRVSLYLLDNLDRETLTPEFLKKFDKMVSKRIPTGFGRRAEEAEESKNFPYKELKCYNALNNISHLRRSMGTLGGGNHYIELDIDDQSGLIYLSIHSGSRNLGKQVCEYYQNKAIEAREQRIQELREAKKAEIAKARDAGNIICIQEIIEKYKVLYAKEPNDDLCYIEGQNMRDYLNDMKLCNEWSKLNHQVIYKEIKAGMEEILDDN